MSRHLLRQALRLPQAAVKRLVTGLLQLVLLANRPARLARSGFVLPTTVLLVVMVVLTATALTYRSFTRSDMAISQREQQVISNAATPAIDRAKAKIEFVFNRDTRLPSGLPTSDFLASMMLTAPYETGVVALPGDPFTLPDETRLDINRDGVLDNAWSFVSSANGETIVYSILADDQGPGTANTVVLQSPVNQAKANALVTRTGPLATTEATSNCSNARSEAGWQVVNNGDSASLQKNFQINVFVPNANSANRTVESFELQQSRIANRGNKWAAWFRYDMEIFAGPVFNINGAMHTDGNLIVNGGNQSGGAFTSYMISSHNSCVYGRQSSEITVADTSDDGTFQGQIVKGDMGRNVYGGNSTTFHTWVTDNDPPRANRTLETTNDSVNGGVPGDVATNPIILFGLDRHVHTNRATWTRDNAWDNNPIRTERRVFNQNVPKPFVDDFSRADNRWGPKPRYSDNNDALDLTRNGLTVGSRIDNSLDQLTDPVEGLDGYWERQATEYGLRLVVGERLELGNPSGWNYNPATNAVDTILQDRLYPPNTDQVVSGKIGASEYRQKRSLRDNLAAVQGMVVYHYDHPNGGDFPAACMAMTAHPGTLQTIRNSRDFTNFPGTSLPYPNFLTGNGTNGWEFNFYAETGFGASVQDPTSNLGKALRNLAYFAGDPRGGAPFFPPVQDTVVHPFPYMAMWGDFSPLRRIFDDYLDATTGAVTYANLSAADKATLHSAACTLGMLGHNLQFASDTTKLLTWGTNLGKIQQGKIITEIGRPIWDAFGGGNSGPAAGSLAAQCIQDASNTNLYDCTNVRPTKEQLIAIAGFDADKTRFVDMIGDLTQIERDRTFGFELSPETAAYGAYEVAEGNKRYRFRFPDNCHPANQNGSLAPLFNSEALAPGQTNFYAGVALVCASRPKYPSLFYLFPKAAHGQRDGQPLTEEFINPARTAYILDTAGTAGVNAGATRYQPVEPITIALAPRLIADWQTPIPPAPVTGTVFNPQANHIIGGIGNVRQVAFLDKGMFDGREQMGIRVLDIDLKRLTSTTVRGGTDKWLSDIACDPDAQDCDVFTEGIVYAYREDAVREEEIVRPKVASQTIDNCLTVTDVISANCRMITTPGSEQDPPLSNALISLKPVDFYGDPDRRPSGFRLLNGVDMSEGRTRAVGMTFVTDNSVYVLGDFNLHSTAGTVATIIEEFKPKIGGVDWTMNNFYNDRKEDPADANGIDVRFSQPDTDTWRPVEILSDSFNILSAGFRDGAVEDTFISPRPGSPASTTTSYMNQSRPNAAQNVVRDVRPPVSASTAANSPVWINRNNNAFIGTNPINTALAASDWTGLGDSDNDRRKNARLVEATNPTTYVNAVVISGIVPSRPRQSYGGLHNFPRLNEGWSEGSNNRNLQIAGAFFQLNFSTAATGPFEHDAWEPGTPPPSNNDERLGYYRPPARRWGYDPGLLYYPPAAAARRFVSVDTPRSEYFRELPSDDPYIANLRCATRSGGAFVFTDPTVRGTCPT